MSTTPGSTAAPIAAVPAPPTQLEAAAAESNEEKPGILTVLGRDFKLMKKLSLGASVDLDTAQRNEDIGGILNATSRLLVKDDRERFLEFMLADGDDEEDTVDLDLFLEALGRAIEGVAGRPTQAAKS